MWVSAGMTEEEMAWRRWVGIGSSGQVVKGGERECVFVIMKLSLVCGVTNWSLMALVLFVKKIAKSSAVRVDGGGGGEQRRYIFERVRTVVNFVVVVWRFSSGDICSEGIFEWLIHTEINRVVLFVPIPLCNPEFRAMFTENIGQPGGRWCCAC